VYVINNKVLHKEFNYYKKIKKRIGFAVTIFGSARTKQNDDFYIAAYNLSRSLAKEAITVITGGGPGIMEAANKGAYEENGISYGFRISLPFEEKRNDFIKQENFFSFNYFFSRKAAFLTHSDAFVVFPGGFGTMDELFEILVHIQNKKMRSIPIFLYGGSFWNGLVDWINNKLFYQCLIDKVDTNIFTVTDDLNYIIEEVRSLQKDCSM
jgi:uncharacterized protein (TIGR00730 family)